MSDIQAAIFDFDGTLADSFDVTLSIAKDLFDIDKELTDAFIEELRGMDRDEVLAALDISRFKALLHYREGKQLMAERVDEISLFDGVEDVVESLSGEYTLGVLTNNDKSIVDDVLDRYGLDCFDFVEDNSVFESKARALSRLVKENCGCRPGQAVYVGDQASDVEAAHKAGCEAVAVAWGYNTRSYLEEVHADRLVDNPDELLSVIQSL